ncbi:uncharacterized protein LOC125036565 [Penaeus chinensis]|uniref:uncharacterized protein LOC125036565 n=1 Tax=Penaeus chinensis TaxID=139456 RepID=UPI001FB6FEBD|nr:uncharacterized protein LOC125036565 [Penaeus chinensis]
MPRVPAFDLAKFIDEPSAELLCEAKKNDWIEIANYYQIAINSSWRKAEIKETVLKHLVLQDLLDSKDVLPLQETEGIFDRELRLKEIELELAKLEDKEKERKFQLEIFERQSAAATPVIPGGHVLGFDIAKVIKFVPPFYEDDPQEFFLQFEHVASNLSWPTQFWSLLVQSVLKGKGRSTYLALESSQQRDYNVVKEAVLKSYRLTPEFYRTKFRQCNKESSQSFVEYSHMLKKLFNRWMSANKASKYDDICEIIMLEQYIGGVPQDVRVYLLEKEVDSVERAAWLAENYSLVHTPKKIGYVRPHHVSNVSHDQSQRRPDFVKPDPARKGFRVSSSSPNSSKWDGTCFYCKTFGHRIRDCPKLKNKEHKAVASNVVVPKPENKRLSDVGDSHDLCAPYKFNGSVSVDSDGVPNPVLILRDTAGVMSMALKSAVPFWEDVLTGQYVLVKGIGGVERSPLCKVYLKSEFVEKSVLVAIADKLPHEGVDFLLCNDIAGDRWGPNVIVCSKPLEVDPLKYESIDSPELFPVCAVTRSKAKDLVVESQKCHSLASNLSEKEQDDIGLKDIFECHKVDDVKTVKLSASDSGVVIKEESGEDELSDEPLTCKKIIEAQKSDHTLNHLFRLVLSDEELVKEQTGYYVKNGILMRKYRPSDEPAWNTWSVLYQIVVPKCFRYKVMGLAHEFVGGHLGVKKTLNKITSHFYWPGISSDVSEFCRSCAICQLVGKPNQIIPPAPLEPIPVINNPFSKVIIDCVGPMPKTKRGNQFLLTIMCCSTRYPDAIPLRSITAKTVVPALTKFFTIFGFPKVLQSDQGSNFTSKLFKDVMKEWGVMQQFSTIYHPESQGALERFHQTFKCMLTKFCKENNKDWDDSVPFVLYAARSAKQESLGYSPNELLFGKNIHGPIDMLYESLINEKNEFNLCDYVTKLRDRLSKVREFAMKNLNVAQTKMKRVYDKNAKYRHFEIGDKVLLFLPCRKQPLQARFEGPYKVLEKVNDLNYVISTPERRKKKRMVHINLMKHFEEREYPVCASGLGKLCFKKKDNFMTENVEQEDNDFVIKDVEVKLKNSDILGNPYSKTSHLSPDQEEDVLKLLQEFLDLFTDTPQVTTLVMHDVKLVPGAVPIKQSPYRMAPLKSQVLKTEIEYLLVAGIIEPSKSHWASPCVLVRKADSSWRLCIDYRKINALTVAAVDEKIRAIQDLPVPTNRKAVQRYLGMTGFYRRFCPNFSSIAKPLTDLTSSKRKFDWTLSCQEAFEKLKFLLCSKPILKGPDFSKPFVLQVDASDVAAGAVLLQLADDDVLHPICYASTKFKKYQCAYSTVEKEALALLMALDKFEIYLGNTGNEIVVFSDHNPLQFVNSMKNRNQRLTRWFLALQPYNLVIKHIKGHENLIADALSRPA